MAGGQFSLRAPKLQGFLEIPIGFPLGTVEQYAAAQSGGSLAFPYPPERAAGIQKAIGFQVPVQIAIGRAQLSNIVEQVRNLILNWSLELEKAGILGENMQFSEQEKGDAKPLTQQFIIQNVGVLGNVTDHATVKNRLSATATIQLDLEQVRNFLNRPRRLCLNCRSPIKKKWALS